ncbi:hypothetical protein CARUB_v10019630mg [Capsella rubella]|uniref:Uncharacterized protein n=1 Tax=Capsella rubella TaxID=81985 RepID=R0HQE9_9BRAS|nr:hypothetical protein CARUB_v10019630mg [Capsella rubella]
MLSQPIEDLKKQQMKLKLDLDTLMEINLTLLLKRLPRFYYPFLFLFCSLHWGGYEIFISDRNLQTMLDSSFG